MDASRLGGVEQHRHGDLGEVVGIDERFAHRVLDHRQRPTRDLLGEEGLGEVLHEEGRAEDGPVGPGGRQGAFGLARSFLATS